MVTAAAGRVTEIRAGTYAFGDRQQWLLGAIPAEGCAAIVVATVVSVFGDRVVLDAGAKSLTKDRPDWIAGYGYLPGYPDLTIERLSDYHAVVPLPGGIHGPRLGEQVAIVPNHICPVVDLFDTFLAVNAGRRGADGGPLETWPVDARGRSR
jgi:D-serine deaminase-like pyridoxal phosphate-dependent protein